MLKLANTLEKKVVLSLLFVFVASIIALYGALQWSVYVAFEQLEQQESEKNLVRAINIVGAQFEELKIITREYSEWDETFNFLMNIDNSLEDNLSVEYFENLGLNCILFLDKEGRVKWGYLSDMEQNLLDLPEQLLEPLNSEHPIVNLPAAGNGLGGFWRIRSGLLLVVSQPVLVTSGKSDSPGSAVFGRYFSDELISDLSELSAAPIQQFAIDSDLKALLQSNSVSTQEASYGLRPIHYVTADKKTAGNSMSLQVAQWLGMRRRQQAAEQNKLIWEMNNFNVYKHLAYQDLFGRFQGILQISTPRDISRLGINSLGMTLFSMLSATVIIGLIFIMIMRAAIIRPIQTIKTHMLRLGSSGTLNERLDMHRFDEIGALASEFDQFTERLAASQMQLEVTRDRALALAKAKSEFLATMSHEIRTPMNGVLGMAELLSRTDLDSKQVKFVQNIQSSGEMLLRVINEILDYSKIESGKMQLEAKSFNLCQLVEETIDMLAAQANNKGLELTRSLPLEFDEWVIGDSIRLRQVLVNLIDNAIKFTNQGEVAVKLSVADERSSLKSILIEVIDTGIGIHEEQQERIFEEFIQADNSSMRHYGGTGLGLSISSQLIQLMGGSIGLDSVLGQGSRFWIALQLPSGQARHSAAQPLSSLKGVKILIVDVDETSRKILNTHVSAWGMSGDNAVDGPQAMEMLHKAAADSTPYDLMLLDYQMPGINGTEVLQRIRDDTQLSNLQVVILGSATTMEKEQLPEHGCKYHFLSKPVQQASLYRCLVKLIGGTQKIQEPEESESAVKQLGAHVLVAEDNLVNQEVVKSLLKAIGCTADIATNGVQAVALSDKGGYDLILMDLHMPVMDGYQAATLIRQRDKENAQGMPLTPIIALTADAHEGAREECVKAGMDDFLPKPISIQILQKKLIKWLPEPIIRTAGTHRILDR